MQHSNLAAAKAELKKVSINELANRGILSPAKHGTFICPNPACRNGSGRDGTGATVKLAEHGEHLMCGKCGDGYDVIDILGFFFGLKPESDFAEIIKRGCEMFNIIIDGDNAYSERPDLPKYNPADEEKNLARIKSTILDAQNNLHVLLNQHGGQWRGLNRITLQDFHIGYIPKWYSRKGAPTSPRVIIPTSFNHYLARLDGKIEDYPIDAHAPEGCHLEEKEHRGNKEIFNFKRALLDSSNPICIVVEGEIDCMSIAQVTRKLVNDDSCMSGSVSRSEYPVNVIAIGGTNPSPIAFAQLKNLPLKKKFIILFDNDDAGKKAAPVFAAKLLSLGHHAAVAELSDKYNDANEFLCKDAVHLQERIEEILEDTVFGDQNLWKSADLNAPAEKTPEPTATVNFDERNGNIEDVLNWLNSLEPETFTAETAHDTRNIHAVALAIIFNHLAEAEKFFSTLKKAKDAAKIRLNDANANLTEPLTDDEENSLNALVEGTNLESLRRAVAREATNIKRSLDKDCKQQAQQKAREDYQKKQAARADRIKTGFDRLQELRAMSPSPERNTEIVQLINQLCEWKYDKYGRPVCVKATQANADLFFGSDPNLDGLIGFDEFRQADVLLKAPPWNKSAKKGIEWTDADDAQLRIYLRKFYKEFTGEKLILDNVTAYSRAHSFHEIKDYFKNLPKWDGVNRAETLFIDWLKVPDTPRNREVTIKWLLGLIARIFHPGCEFQWSLVIHGNQGCGKGFILERLGGKWYLAISDRVDDHAHIFDTIKLCWIGEFKEFAGLKKADIDAIKAFIELRSDTRRSAYERRARTIPRHCLFAMSSNSEVFLGDLTGNRRFQILASPLPKFGYIKEVRNEKLTDDNIISQIWAEVFARYQEIFKDAFDERKLELSADAKRIGEEIANNYVNDNGLTGIVQDFVDRKILPPVLWELLTREERRSFAAEGKFEIEEAVLTARFKTAHKKISSRLQAEFATATIPCDAVLRTEVRNRVTGTFVAALTFFGTEYRQSICAAEISAEAFAPSDKKNSPAKINEILAHLDGWHLGGRLRNNPAYGNQRKIYYRDEGNQPNGYDDEIEPTPDDPNTLEHTTTEDFILRGEPFAPYSLPPFDPEDRTI